MWFPGQKVKGAAAPVVMSQIVKQQIRKCKKLSMTFVLLFVSMRQGRARASAAGRPRWKKARTAHGRAGEVGGSGREREGAGGSGGEWRGRRLTPAPLRRRGGRAPPPLPAPR